MKGLLQERKGSRKKEAFAHIILLFKTRLGYLRYLERLGWKQEFCHVICHKPFL